MSKHLYLLRHAEAGEKISSQHDRDRELTTKGIKQSVQIGSFLLKNHIVLDAVYSSPSNRTRETTQLISDAIKLDLQKIHFVDELYEASTRTFFQLITQVDNVYNHVMFVGHNPTISYLAEYLTKAEVPEMTTGSLVIISFKADSWNEVSQGTGSFVNYIDPLLFIN